MIVRLCRQIPFPYSTISLPFLVSARILPRYQATTLRDATRSFKRQFKKGFDSEDADPFQSGPHPVKNVKKISASRRKSPDKHHDGMGTNFWGQTVTKKEAKQFDKAKALGDVQLMRSILRIPYGKVLPGYEELGDGVLFKEATTNFEGRELFKKEARDYRQAAKKGNVLKMRSILKIPLGEVFPGHEELGDGITVPKKDELKSILAAKSMDK